MYTIGANSSQEFEHMGGTGKTDRRGSKILPENLRSVSTQI